MPLEAVAPNKTWKWDVICTGSLEGTVLGKLSPNGCLNPVLQVFASIVNQNNQPRECNLCIYKSIQCHKVEKVLLCWTSFELEKRPRLHDHWGLSKGFSIRPTTETTGIRYLVENILSQQAKQWSSSKLITTVESHSRPSWPVKYLLPWAEFPWITESLNFLGCLCHFWLLSVDHLLCATHFT